MEKSMVIPQNVKCRITIWSSNSTSEYIHKRTESRDSPRYLCVHAHSSIMHKSQRWKRPKCPLTDEWMNKMWYIHSTMEYYSALKRNEILTHATVWINFKDIILSEINQWQKDNCYAIPLTWVTRVVKFIEIESRMVVPRGWGWRENGELVF